MQARGLKSIAKRVVNEGRLTISVLVPSCGQATVLTQFNAFSSAMPRSPSISWASMQLRTSPFSSTPKVRGSPSCRLTPGDGLPHDVGSNSEWNMFCNGCERQCLSSFAGSVRVSAPRFYSLSLLNPLFPYGRLVIWIPPPALCGSWIDKALFCTVLVFVMSHAVAAWAPALPPIVLENFFFQRPLPYLPACA